MNQQILKQVHLTLRNTDDFLLVYEQIKNEELDNNTKNYIDSLVFLLKQDYSLAKKYFDKIEFIESEEDSFTKNIYYLLMFKIDAIFLDKSELCSKLKSFLESNKLLVIEELYNIVERTKDILEIINFSYRFKCLDMDNLDCLKYYSEIKLFRKNVLKADNDTYYLLTENNRCLKYLRPGENKENLLEESFMEDVEDDTQTIHKINPYNIKVNVSDNKDTVKVNNIDLPVNEIVYARVNKEYRATVKKNKNLLYALTGFLIIMLISWILSLTFLYKNTVVAIIISIIYVIFNVAVFITCAIIIYGKTEVRNKLVLLEVEILKKDMSKIKIDMLNDQVVYEDEVKAKDLIDKAQEMVDYIRVTISG